MYKTNPHTLQELSNNIGHDFSTIYGEEFQTVNIIFCSCIECIQLGRQHFQHLLQHWWVFIKLFWRLLPV